MIRALCILAYVVSVLGLVGIARAHAHGDAQWIADGGYIGADHIKCCGPTDCERLEASRVSRAAQGWAVDGAIVMAFGQRPGLYQSIDGDFWWCRTSGGHEGRTVRCLFVPGRPSA